MKINVSVRVVKQSKYIEEGTMGTIEQNGNHYKIYVLETPDWVCTLAHEVGHLIQMQVKNAKQDETLAEAFEDIVRKWVRSI